MTFSAKDVADLRQKTGAGIMECKHALKEANGDTERAKEILRQKGLIAASKKAEKTTLEGIVASKISSDKRCGVIIELNSQTDFVAKNDLFLELAETILNTALTYKTKNLNDLLKSKSDGVLISELISGKIATIGENIQLRRMDLFELGGENGLIGTYIHPVGKKIGVLVKLTTKPNSIACSEELAELAKNISMHIAACQPQAEYINRLQIPKEVIENEKRIEMGKEDLAKKPKEIAEKIVQGRVEKILSQKCLLEQPYIKDQLVTIEKLLKEKNKELNNEINITQFVRYNVGEIFENPQNSKKKWAVGIS